MRFLPFALFLGGFAATSVAQSPPPAEAGTEIVVTGNRDMEGEVRDFVGALTTATSGQLARFENAICPFAVGVSARHAQTLATRIRRIAEAVGMDAAKAGCTPNVLVVVTGDKTAFIDALLKKHPDYFGSLTDRAVRRLARSPGPAAVWHVNGPERDADGEEMSDGSDGAYVNRTTRAGSRMTAATRPQFGAAAVVVEARALEGLTTIQLADYAAMRAFARGDPSKLPGTAPTILKVLETPMGEPAPITLTAWDLAFLRSLYSAPANLSAAAQRSSIRRGVTKELEKSDRRD